MKKIYVIAVLLLVAVFVMTAAIPKVGPMVVLTLRNKMLTSEAHISLNGLTAFHTYYLTARAWPVDVKFPNSLANLLVGKAQKTTYEIRADFYEGTVYSCGAQRSGVFDFTNRTRLTFPNCAKDNPRNMGEPRQEKINTGLGWPGYFDPSGVNRYTCVGGAAVWTGPGNKIYGNDVWCDQGYTGPNVRNEKAGDGYSDGDVDGNFLRSINGAQIRWSIDFLNYVNKGTDYWH